MNGKVDRPYRKRSFYALFLTLVLVFIIPMVTLLVAFDTAIRETVLSDYLSLNIRSVENVRNTVDTYVSARVSFAARLISNLALKQLTGALDETEEETRSACRELQFYVTAIQSYDSIFYHAALYLPGRDLLISSQNMRQDGKTFYRLYANFENMDAETFYESVRSARMGKFFPAQNSKTASTDVTRRVMLYVQPVKIGYLVERAYFLSLVDADAFESLFADGFDAPIHFRLLDSEGAELTRSAGFPAPWLSDASEAADAHWETTNGNERYWAFATAGKASSLRFIFYVPETAVLKRLNTFQTAWLAALGACSLLGLLLARLIAKRLYAPYQSMLTRVFPSGLDAAPRNMREGYALVADEVLRAQTMYQKEMQAYSEAMCANMLIKLLTQGERLSEEELREAAELCALPDGDAAYRVVLADFSQCPADGSSPLAGFRAALAARNYAMALVSRAQLAVVLAENAGAPALPALPEKARAGVSEAHPGMRNLYRGLREAYAACLRSARARDGYVRYEQLEPSPETIYYPIERELQLIAAVRTGAFPEARAQLTELYEYNRDQRRLAPEMIVCLLNSMIATAFKACEGLSGPPDAPAQGMRLVANLTAPGLAPEAAFADIAGFYERLCESAQSALTHKNRDTIDNVIGYLQAEYHNPAMCLDMVADHFGVSYYFLSHIFKEEANQSFSDILGDIRVEQAVRLLQSTALTVNEISERVGYASASTLQRAFRKRMGTTPQAFRESV